MKKQLLIILICLNNTIINAQFMSGKIIKLPDPTYNSKISIEKALKERRSTRTFRDIPLSISELSQLLWAGQGINDNINKFRTYPSAGALYPLELYVIINKVQNLEKGFYYYDPYKHAVIKIFEKNILPELTKAALNQEFIKESAIVFIYTANKSKTTSRYGERGLRYIFMEAGHAAQNIYLQAVTYNIGLVVIGAFKDNEVKQILNLKDDEIPLYIIPAGKK